VPTVETHLEREVQRFKRKAKCLETELSDEQAELLSEYQGLETKIKELQEE
jgi:phage host-nuclease inhibitor protein Gam